MEYDSEQLDRLEPNYLSLYGLKQAPFSPSHDDRLVYLDAERTQRLNMLQHLTQFSDLLLLVKGEYGSGKTTLMQRFLQSAEDDWRICQVDATPMMHADPLLRQIASGFGLHPLPDQPAQLQQSLFEHLLAFQHRAINPILVVDDAHELPEDALQTLFNLADSKGADENLLRTILFCEPQIETTLHTPAIQPLRQRVTHTLEVPTLTEEQVAEYLRHRMTVCGARGEYPFTPKHIRRIFQASAGVPEKINQLAHQVLRDGKLDASQTPRHTPKTTRRFSPTYTTLALALLLMISLGLTYQDEINALFETAPRTAPAVIEFSPSAPKEQSAYDAAAPAYEPAVAGLPGTEAQPVISDAPEENLLPAHQQTVVDTSGSRIAEATADTTSDTEISATQQDSPQSDTGTVTPGDTGLADPPPQPKITQPPLRIYSLTPIWVVGSDKEQTLTLKGDGFHNKIHVSVAWDGQTKKLLTESVTVVDANHVIIRLTTGTKAQDWRIVVDDPGSKETSTFKFRVNAPPEAAEPKAEPLPKPTTTTKEFATDSTFGAWLRAQNPQYFTIQLLTARQEKTAAQFVKDHKLTTRLGYVKTSKAGKFRYTVLTGAYPTRTTAQTAMQNLPAEIKQLRPWVRQLDGVVSQLEPITGPRPTPPAAATPKFTAIPTDPNAHIGWLWSQNPKSFTLQLLASHHENNVRRFVREHRLEGQVVWFKTRKNNRDWFALVYGVFPSRDAAKQATSRLPATLRESPPWIRSFASIHAEIQPR